MSEYPRRNNRLLSCRSHLCKIIVNVIRICIGAGISCIIAFVSAVNDDKITFLAVCGKNAVAKGFKAGELVKLVCTHCGGSGGGKPDSAMGGGKDVNKLDDALALVDDFVAGKI